MNTYSRVTPVLNSSYRLLAKFLSLIVRVCLWTADKLAYAVMSLEANSER